MSLSDVKVDSDIVLPPTSCFNLYSIHLCRRRAISFGSICALRSMCADYLIRTSVFWRMAPSTLELLPPSVSEGSKYNNNPFSIGARDHHPQLPSHPVSHTCTARNFALLIRALRCVRQSICRQDFRREAQEFHVNHFFTPIYVRQHGRIP